MGKKMKLPFLSKNTAEPTRLSSSSSSSTWPWPSCTQTRTLSFRTGHHDIFKSINSAYLESTIHTTNVAEPPESFFTNSSECASLSTASEDFGADPVLEAVTRGLRSERLFFKPGETSSILEEAAKLEAADESPFKQSVVLSMDSQDPYLDFKRSMEEMVEAHGFKDWEGLEELLSWYLKVNGKSNHGYIVAAFVDLLVGLAIASSSSSSSSSTSNCNSPSSPLSFYTTTSSSSSSSTTTPCISSTEAEEEIETGTTTTTTPCLSSLLEAHEEDNINEEDDDVNS